MIWRLFNFYPFSHSTKREKLTTFKNKYRSKNSEIWTKQNKNSHHFFFSIHNISPVVQRNLLQLLSFHKRKRNEKEKKHLECKISPVQFSRREEILRRHEKKSPRAMQKIRMENPTMLLWKRYTKKEQRNELWKCIKVNFREIKNLYIAMRRSPVHSMKKRSMKKINGFEIWKRFFFFVSFFSVSHFVLCICRIRPTSTSTSS